VTNLKRDVTALGARFGLTIFLSVLIGTIFLKVGEEDRGVFLNAQSSFGALIMVALMSMFGTAQPALLAFPDERPVFLREYSTNHYNVVSYFLSRLTMEAFITAIQVLVSVTISYLMIGFKSNYGILYGSVYALAMASTALAVLLGCSVEDPKLAQEMLPILFVPQMLFAGFFVPPSLIPTWLRWARYLCTLTYSVRILLVAEFEECAKSEPNCKAVMENVQAKSDETWWNWLVLIGLFLVFRLLALKTLRSKATKFF
jgi:ABC-type multidrug transport system permease subunit